MKHRLYSKQKWDGASRRICCDGAERNILQPLFFVSKKVGRNATVQTRKVHYILLIFSITTLLCVTPRLSYKPKTEPPLEPAKLPSEAQILPALVPSHSNLMSSDKNLTLPNSAAFSQPNKLSGNLQEPSVTVLDLAKLAEEVIARFLSFISLFASEEANKSSVKPACACMTGLDKVTTTAAAKAADLLKETFFCAEAVGFAAACVCVCVCVCVVCQCAISFTCIVRCCC